ncbi:SH3 domain-containing protein [Taibaiella koreensis]|uniref:hypothetical protein n=1 Tax=Taibaiella koreensis TaxID=1268548 RepID=UPI000E59D93D|nr:hypothetical protein [Taibaiella koreensis]
MDTKSALTWFRQQFGAQLDAAAQHTPYTTDLLCAIAYQETGHIWSRMIGKLALPDIVRLCVGDIIDAPGRSAFPRNKTDLLSIADGQQMFDIARQCFEQMAAYITEYKPYLSNKNKFCHGYGIFQYDLQHFKADPQYFLQQDWANFALCLSKCLGELEAAQQRQGWRGKTTLSDEEMVYVAIAYNKGKADLRKGFKQGYYDKNSKKYYGEYIFEYLMLARSLKGADSPGAPLSYPEPVAAGSRVYRVQLTDGTLNLRREPAIPVQGKPSNVLTRLPQGQLVNWLSGKKTDGWYLVETTMNGAYFKGYASAQYLVPEKEALPDVLEPVVSGPLPALPPAYLPVRPGTITRRTDPANARSLNETGQPQRNAKGTPSELTAALLQIIDWLDVTNPKYKRYQPADGKTFCNIYAHDYCYLAGVYFPRVWWTPGTVARLSAGGQATPVYGDTVLEMQANALLVWLKDFGPGFGWQRTATLNELQHAANLGAVALIIGRRIADKGPGHVVIIAPETDVKAKRDVSGIVTLPVQSQAGASNIKLGNGTAWWLNSNKFAEYAFWVHA